MRWSMIWMMPIPGAAARFPEEGRPWFSFSGVLPVTILKSMSRLWWGKRARMALTASRLVREL